MKTRRNKYWVNYQIIRNMNPCSELHRFVTACGGITAVKRLGYFHVCFILNKMGHNDFEWVCNGLGIDYAERVAINQTWTASLQDYAILRARIRFVEAWQRKQTK